MPPFVFSTSAVVAGIEGMALLSNASHPTMPTARRSRPVDSSPKEGAS